MADALRVIPQDEHLVPYCFSLLIVDDEPETHSSCQEAAKSEGFLVSTVDSAAALQRQLAARPVDVILLDLRLVGANGVDLLAKVKEQYPDTEVIVASANATVPAVLGALKSGAFDYLPKPFNIEEFKLLLQRVAARLQDSLEERSTREKLVSNPGYAGLVGQSAEMQKLYRII
ncbi:MAG: response regulator, partial [Terriglobales bacterium]